MLYFGKTASTYDEAIKTCSKYNSQLLEIKTEEEWSEVRSKLVLSFVD